MIPPAQHALKVRQMKPAPLDVEQLDETWPVCRFSNPSLHGLNAVPAPFQPAHFHFYFKSHQDEKGSKNGQAMIIVCLDTWLNSSQE